MTVNKIKDRIASMASHVTFSYKGMDCGVDPLAQNRFDLWCGDSIITVDSIDAVMSTPFFIGQALKDIVQDLTNIEW